MVLQQKLMERITVTPQIPPSKLPKTIQTYTKNLPQNPITTTLQQQLKHPNPPCLSPITPNFIENCIKVCVAFQLSGIVKGVEDLCNQAVLREIRDYYFWMGCQEGERGWASEFLFQRAMVGVTKVVADFFNSVFLDITVDDKLESEIYVILIYILMGIKIGTKSYSLLQKKYLKPKQQASESERKQKKQRRTFIKPSHHRIHNQDHWDRRDQRDKDRVSISFFNRTQPLHKTTNFLCAALVPESSTDMFLRSLKKDLYVPPLPQIVKQKKSIQSFSSQGQHLQKIPKNLSNLLTQSPKNQPLLSNQLSISLHSQITQHRVSIATQSKPLKIKHRSPNFSGHFIIFKNKVSNEAEDSEDNLLKDKQKQEKWRLSSEDWRKIVGELRVGFGRKDDKGDLGDFRRNYRDYDCDSSSKELDKTHSKLTTRSPHKPPKSLPKCPETPTQSLSLSLSMPPPVPSPQPQKFTNINAGVHNFKQVFLTQNENHLVKKSVRVNKNMLREERKEFDKEVMERHEKIKYTMFLLPKMGKNGNKVL